MKKLSAILAAFLVFFTISPVQVFAIQGSVLGIHILSPSEGENAKQLLSSDPSPDNWHYVTIPLGLDDLQKQDQWQKFFDYAKQQKLIPIVRYVTRFENGAWKIPTKKDVVDLTTFVSSLNWPTDQMDVIAFNEVNHNTEWGGQVDPQGYAEILRFTSDWVKSEDKTYKVLPAAMDLSAPNSSSTMEAFAYLDKMAQSNPQIFDYIDYDNAHAYPNPGFSSAPSQTGKKSLSGYQAELAYLKQKTGKEFQTFITETGWVDNSLTNRQLDSYYAYAAQHVWNDPRIIAVTPFVLQGDPGPFSGFSFIDRNGKPTHQYEAYQKVMRDFTSKL